ncbi:MAG: efflux RND transporter periplasmic adaptor subunit [Acidobacteria bacterium]|nr:efflux RND transporter periplasmic adaptor subunit [Acidobacteriota bacterium]
MIKKLAIAVVVLAVIAAGIYSNTNRTPSAQRVQTESIEHRELTAKVSGSGQIRPFREIDMSSNVMGRVEELAVQEGEEVSTGQFLLRIDPVRYASAVEQVQASIASAETSLTLAEQNLQYAREVLDRRQGLYEQDLLSEEAYLDALQNVRREERTVQLRQGELDRLSAQLKQSEHDLAQVLFTSPLDGVITKLNIEEGETAITGTMNNPGTVLLTIADLSFIEAEIEIDETDIVDVAVGQPAEVRIDAFPDDVFAAEVIEVGRSPISAVQSTSQAVNFKVVVRVIEQVPGARPGLSCTADVITATRRNAVAVPIQSLILREVRLDDDGNVVELDPVAELLAEVDGEAATDPAELEEIEGAFLMRDGEARFAAVEVGIAGERHFEVISGIEAGDEVVTGPFDIIRSLASGDRIEKTGASGRAGNSEAE